MRFPVLHLDTEFGWRGGQQQLAYLAAAMTAENHGCLVVGQPDSALLKYCRDNGLPHAALRMHGELDLFAGYRIAALCRRNGLRLIHLHSGHAVTLGLWAKLFRPQLKLVATRRVDFALKSGIFSRLKYVNPLLDQIVCVSREIERILVASGVPPQRVATIHSGVALDKFKGLQPSAHFRNKWGIAADDVIVGTVAALVGHKDYPTLLRAARLALDRDPGLVFCAVGDGPLESEIHELARELSLGKRFIFAGYQQQVGPFIKNFDLFVLSSNQEGLGTSILDAQAAGIPVVACAAGGIPEMIADGVNGRLVPPESPSRLSEAILELAGDLNQRRRLAEKALESVTAFSVESTVAKYLTLYTSLLQ